MKNQNSHNPISRTALMWLAFVVSCLTARSQTTNISGTVNIYQKVIEVIPAKACVRVSSTAGLNASAKVMLIQMKGASIITTNNSTFGDTTSLNEAGNYEIGTICAMRGDTVFLVNDILNNYSPTSGKVQLVQFGEYVSANVIGMVTASPWDNVSGTGGVIAIFAEQDIILNQSINANTSGFSGGAFVQSNTTCNNFTSGYAYNGSLSTPQSGAYKGEAVADVAVSQSGGRGAPANGGGGGNNHNNSGGGGANLDPGGLGGGNSSSVSCTAAFKGEGGKALNSWNGQKIFLGGGGGAGHNNNAVFTVGGANGGGIIFIHATNIVGNGNSISANGGKGGNTQADGAGGGGAGGTIIMDVANYTGSVTIEANGGAGGDSNDGGNINRCYGGGGGGSGGVIYFNGALPAATINVNAGAAGVETGRDAGCAAEQAALPGTAGRTISSYTYRTSSSLAGYCAIILPAKLVSFRASSSSQKTVDLQWVVGDPGAVTGFSVERLNSNQEWISIGELSADPVRSGYSFTDNYPATGYNAYRVMIRQTNNSIFYSSVRHVLVEGENDKFNIYPNPAKNRIYIQSNTTGSAYLQIQDLSGKSILQQKILLTTQAVAVELPELPSGIYLLRINNTVKKLVIGK